MAIACLCLAAATRWFGWPAALPLTALSGAAAVLFARTYAGPRGGTISDRVAAAIDADAGLGGELRSASWFSGREQRDAWADYHVRRAADRLRGTDWSQLYPAVRARRAKLATSALVFCALALSITWPHPARVWPGSTTKAAAAAARRTQEPPLVEVALPELQKQLEALLASAESGTAPPAGTPATAAELRSLIASLTALRDAGKLKDLAHAMAPLATTTGGRSDDPAGEMKALADRAQKAAERPAVAPDVRETLQKVSEKMSDAARTAQSPREQTQQAASSKDAQKGDTAQSKGGGDVDEVSIQAVREADAGGGAGIIMMGSKDDASGKAAPGLGLGGGSDKRTDGGTMADLEAVLRREIIEASTDNPGENVQTEARRKTEHGEATVTYAHSAAGTFDRSRAVAPPAVPEGRRAAVQSYFIRKQ